MNNIRDQWILDHLWEVIGIREKSCICLIISRISLKTVRKTNPFFLNLLDGPLRTGSDFGNDHFRRRKNTIFLNFKSLHKDLRHSNVKRYELAPKRHVDIKGSGRLYK